MLEAILIELGSSVAVQIFEVKVKERLNSGTIRDLLIKRGHTVLDSRRAERQFGQIAEAVAARLEDFLEIETAEMPENEVAAALITVKDCIRDSAVDYPTLLEVDLDPTTLEKLILKTTTVRQKTAALSEAGEFVFGQVLRECCNYVTEIALQIPELHGKALRALRA